MNLDGRLARDAEQWRKDDHAPSFDDALEIATVRRGHMRTTMLAVACGVALVVALVGVLTLRSQSGERAPAVHTPALPVQLPTPRSINRDGNTYYAQVVPTDGVVLDAANKSQLLAYKFDLYNKQSRPVCNRFGSSARVISQDADTVTVATISYESLPRTSAVCGFTAFGENAKPFVLKLDVPLRGRQVIDAYSGSSIAVFTEGTTPPKPGYLPVGMHGTGIEAAGSSSVSGATSSRSYSGGGPGITITLSSVGPDGVDGTVIGHEDVQGHSATITQEDYQRCVTWNLAGSRQLQVCGYTGEKNTNTPVPELLKIARSLK